MMKTRGPPRRPSRETGAGGGAGGSPGGGAPPASSDGRAATGPYRPMAAQEPSTTAGFGAAPRYAPLAPAPHPSPTHPTAPIYPAHDTEPDDAQQYSGGGGGGGGGDDERHGAADTGAGPAAAEGPGVVGDETAALAEYPYSIYNHGTWTAEDDKTLIQARARGLNWADLQRTHFPSKTANACRKRYERLVERRGIHDYSGRRLEMVANEYMNMRREIWSGLADRLGMKWEVVEALCMGAGLRTIQSNARSYTNRARRDNRVSQKAREAQAEAASAGSMGLPLPALPVGSEFGTAFRGHGGAEADRNAGARAADRSMPPPPPFFAASGPPPLQTARLPPMVLAPQDRGQAPYRGYSNGGARSAGPPYTAGPAPEPPPTNRPPDW